MCVRGVAYVNGGQRGQKPEIALELEFQVVVSQTPSWTGNWIQVRWESDAAALHLSRLSIPRWSKHTSYAITPTMVWIPPK